MPLESQVTSKELSEKLKALGVKQESAFYWFFDKICLKTSKNSWTRIDELFWEQSDFSNNDNLEGVSAFTSSELGEMLKTLNWQIENTVDGYRTWVEEEPMEEHDEFGFTMAESLAKAVIYCIDNKLLTP